MVRFVLDEHQKDPGFAKGRGTVIAVTMPETALEAVMRTEMGLTIQDYFNRRVDARPQPKTINRAKMDSRGVQSPFSKALAAARASASEKPQGLSIQDYLQRRIPSATVASIGEIPTVVSPRMPRPVAGLETSAGRKVLPDAGIPPRASIAAQRAQENLPATDKHQILDSINKAAARYKLPAALIKAVVKAESNYQIRAVSAAGAQGLMQLMPATARELGVTDPFDIDQNIHGGAQYLRNMLDQFNGDVHMALSAYNAGPGTVARYDGNVPYAETRAYIQRVMRYAEEFSAPGVT